MHAHHKISTYLFSFLVIIGWSQAQNDSTTLIHAAWQTDTIQGMILWRTHFEHHEYFNSNQYISYLEIPAQAQLELALAYEPTRTKTSEIAQQHAALAAINGSFFDMDKHNPICYLRINGKEISENVAGADTVHRKYYQYGTLAIDSGQIRIIRTDSARNWERTLPFANIMTAGPLLIYHGEEQSMRNDLKFVYQRHNRSAIGLRPDGSILLFVVDGRTHESEGMSLDELIHTLRWLGCENALNLDGGGSSTLYIEGMPHHGIINYPTDNGLFDHKGERRVSNAILVTTKNETK